ncbi:hypothetical protein PoB_006904400 [Plakobranchus ocellatus]|uniref:Uncharacterized protein n=1 Tax=Plakobranchus ocellatus TaxID=259542 RepID=A0AAV4DEJ5_9GAST|nr:hypothetical protein PoB_006904400 [Plakobranchus ocellatus]
MQGLHSHSRSHIALYSWPQSSSYLPRTWLRLPERRGFISPLTLQPPVQQASQATSPPHAPMRVCSSRIRASLTSTLVCWRSTPGQGAGGGARTRDRRVPANLRVDSLATVPPMLWRRTKRKYGEKQDKK